MATLYRKYRPQDFSEVVGQNHIKLTLEHEIASDKIAHAYLFCGPRAVGKTTISRVFSKAINCTNRKEGEHEPCNKCDVCNEINLARNLDIIEIDAASHTGVDNVRDNIISVSRLAPSRSKYKVFIIDEVHMLSVSAFNALLKTLEEPPSTAIFILCTTEVHKIPATIISRCQRFDFKRISLSDIVKRLEYIAGKEEIKIDRSVLEMIARQSEGHLRDAVSLLGQVISIGGKEITQEEADLVIPRSDLTEAINFIGFLAKKDPASAIGLVNKLINEGVELKRFTNDLVEILRKIMLAKVSPILSEKLGLELGETLDIEVNKVSKELELAQIVLAIERLMKAREEIKTSFISQLPLEIAITEICLGISSNVAVQQTTNTPNTQTVAARPAVKSIEAPIPQEVPPMPEFENTTPPVNEAPSPAPVPQVAEVKPTPSPSAPKVQDDEEENKEGSDHVFVEVQTGQPLISRDDLRNKWSEVIIRVKKYNHSLPFILQVCDPRDVNGNQVCLAFKYKFHKERLADQKIVAVMEKAFQEVFNVALTVESIIDETLDPNSGPSLASTPAPAQEENEQQTQDSPVEENNVSETPDENKPPIHEEPQANAAPPAEGGDGMINDLLKTFGGKVVG